MLRGFPSFFPAFLEKDVRNLLAGDIFKLLGWDFLKIPNLLVGEGSVMASLGSRTLRPLENGTFGFRRISEGLRGIGGAKAEVGKYPGVVF